MRKLTETQREILAAMADGHEMIFSQDGDLAWLWPKHPSGFLDDASLIGLRNQGFIASAPYDEDEHVRFGPPTIITPSGRLALKGGEDGR